MINFLGVIVDPLQEDVQQGSHIPELAAADFVQFPV
jgi:hypothetical protein